MAHLMKGQLAVTRIAAGAYRVDHDTGSDRVYVAGSPQDQWAFWNGRIFHHRPTQPTAKLQRPRSRSAAGHSLTAPMPSTVTKILVSAGDAVRKGDTIVVLEAMKMELPVRAPADATVKAVHYREGDLVPPDATLVELE